MLKSKTVQLDDIFRFSFYLSPESARDRSLFVGITGIECDSGINPLINMRGLKSCRLRGR